MPKPKKTDPSSVTATLLGGPVDGLTMSLPVLSLEAIIEVETQNSWTHCYVREEHSPDSAPRYRHGTIYREHQT